MNSSPTVSEMVFYTNESFDVSGFFYCDEVAEGISRSICS